VILDYFFNETLRDTHRSDVSLMRQAARIMGEEYMFGIDEGQIEPFLTQRGLRDIRDVRLEQWRPLCFTGPNAGRVFPAGLAIASASVNQTQE
jgi:O-methyltransferase involved in polyketide biosynthesis